MSETVNHACSIGAHTEQENTQGRQLTEELADRLAAERGVRVRPNEALNEIDEFNDWLFPTVNNVI